MVGEHTNSLGHMCAHNRERNGTRERARQESVQAAQATYRDTSKSTGSSGRVWIRKGGRDVPHNKPAPDARSQDGVPFWK